MTAVEHVNALTKRWLAEAGADSAVLSAVGVWPLLAFLADGAAGADDADETRAELSAAIGVPAEEAARAARELLEVVTHTPSVKTALGLWTRDQVRVREDWLGRLPGGVHGELTGEPGIDQTRLDAWASERTEGLIPQLPIEVSAETMFVLASALLVSVTWRNEFTATTDISAGPWADARGRLECLRQFDADLDLLHVADTPIGRVTAVTVEGDEDVDVVLVLGPAETSPSEVLAVGTALIGAPRHPMTRGTDLPVGDAGPGVLVETVESIWNQDSLVTTTVPFRIAARHDLLDRAALFGLQNAMVDSDGHFPGVSDYPLYVQQAVQDAVAEFSKTGFRAAAVTAIDMFGTGAPRERYQVRRVSVTFDRPFAYYAVHRDSGLILVAGWVTEPSRAQDVSSGSAERHRQIRGPLSVR
ncbi:serpin family protein [Catenulispora sp. GP43]|uniref:serpin family protein n=1 Tax=Catenulispora sp. GP43 TaxID=3156263 RepID=UPI0035147DDA